MLSIESLILGVFNFFYKLSSTILSIGFRTGSLFKDLCLGHKEKYLDARIYLVVSVLCSFTLFAADGDSFLERFNSAGSELTNSKNLILAFPIALLMYAVIFVFARALQFSPKYFEIYIDYFLYWMGTYVWGYVLGSMAMIFTLDLLGHDDLDGSLASDVIFLGSMSSYILFFLIVPVLGVKFLGIFSKQWFKFASVTLAAPLIIFLSLSLVSKISADERNIVMMRAVDEAENARPDLTVSDLHCTLLDSVTTDSLTLYNLEIKFRLRNRSNEPYYVQNGIFIRGSLSDKGPFKCFFSNDAAENMMEIKPSQIIFYSMYGVVYQEDYRTLSKDGGIPVSADIEYVNRLSLKDKTFTDYQWLYLH